MKKIIYLFIILLVSCSLNNTPTKRVEELLGKYQTLNKKITINYKDINENAKELYKKEYEEIIKKQYKNMTYEIKEEKIDGNYAEVTAEIEVLDYKEIIDNNKDNEEELITKLKKAKNTIMYTLVITLTKDDKKRWEIDGLTEEQKKKLLGIN